MKTRGMSPVGGGSGNIDDYEPLEHDRDGLVGDDQGLDYLGSEFTGP